MFQLHKCSSTSMPRLSNGLKGGACLSALRVSLLHETSWGGWLEKRLARLRCVCPYASLRGRRARARRGPPGPRASRGAELCQAATGRAELGLLAQDAHIHTYTRPGNPTYIRAVSSPPLSRFINYGRAHLALSHLPAHLIHATQLAPLLHIPAHIGMVTTPAARCYLYT